MDFAYRQKNTSTVDIWRRTVKMKSFSLSNTTHKEQCCFTLQFLTSFQPSQRQKLEEKNIVNRNSFKFFTTLMIKENFRNDHYRI